MRHRQEPHRQQTDHKEGGSFAAREKVEFFEKLGLPGGRLAQNTIDLPNLPIDDSCEDEKQAARRAGLAFEVALIQSAQSAVVDAPGEGV